MKKKFMTLMLCSALFGLGQLSANAAGILYENTDYPLFATGADGKELHKLRKGESSLSYVLGLIETGDASIDTAAKNGGIKKIYYADVNKKSVLYFVWGKTTVTVYGE